MADPKHTQEQIKKYKSSTQTSSDPHERGKNDLAANRKISHKEADKMSDEEWQDYVDGRMGRKKRQKNDVKVEDIDFDFTI